MEAFVYRNVLNFIPRLKEWRSKGEKVVFTNGCFDILHVGHVRYLQEARQMGQRLVIGLNADDSVRRLKGAKRPINPEMDRAEVLAALEAVDAVVIFGEDTPLQLIESILPDVLVKGGDYRIKDIVGSDIVLKNGGVVKSLGFTEGKSTTGIIERTKIT